MSKKQPIEPQPVRIVPTPKITGLDVPDGCLWVMGTLVAVLGIIAGVLSLANREPSSRPAEPWPGWAVLGIIAGVLVALGIIYLVARVVILVLRHWTELEGDRLKARQVRRDANGQAPLLFTRDGLTLVDPDVAPAGVVNGLRRGADVSMPTPETEAHETAAARQATIRLVRAAANGPAAMGQMALQSAVRELSTPLPEVRELEEGGHVERLLAEVIEGEVAAVESL